MAPTVSAHARLAVSRATYYRYLRQARARVAAALVDRAASPSANLTARQVGPVRHGR